MGKHSPRETRPINQNTDENEQQGAYQGRHRDAVRQPSVNTPRSQLLDSLDDETYMGR